MKKLLLLLVLLAVGATTLLWLRYGGGHPYPDLTTTPALRADRLETVLDYPEPIGSVAVSATGRIFFTVHPAARPEGNRLLEYVDGAAVPYPDVRSQLDLFDTVLGAAVDRFGRLWTIDHGNHGLRQPRLLAFDLATNELIHDVSPGDDIAPLGSSLHDVQVSADGNFIVIADASIWGRRPALIVYDLRNSQMRRVLEGRPSVAAEDYVISSNGREVKYLGGIVALRGGVADIALDSEWLYFGALSGSGLYRVRVADLIDTALPAGLLDGRVERIANKPLSGGMSIDADGNVYVTDIEHNAIAVVGADHRPRTLLRSADIRWPDALSFGPDGWLYVADSALHELILQPRDNIERNAPYRIHRLRPGDEAIARQRQ